jgi:hypothetical protein
MEGRKAHLGVGSGHAVALERGDDHAKEHGEHDRHKHGADDAGLHAHVDVGGPAPAQNREHNQQRLSQATRLILTPARQWLQ